jgi:hypothetical protein
VLKQTPLLALWFAVVAAVAAAACGSGDASSRGGVTVEPIASPTTTILLGGKPAGPPTPTAEPAETLTVASEPPGEPVAMATPIPEPTSTPASSAPPKTGRWIDVDVTNFVVRMMDGETVVQELEPVGVGEQIDTGAYLSTQTGLFTVHTKVEALAYDAPFDTYISHWIGFDTAKDNGFHSFLKDASGEVVDASTGRVSNGCIRVGAIEALFAFAEIGMPVYVHL